MLDIIIPYYNRKALLIRLLDSIKTQDLDKDNFKITIVDDCSEEELKPEDLDYEMNITIIRANENGGPGVSREIGIVNTSGDYITFCDADDELYDDSVLSKYINNIGDSDVLITAFVEEMPNKFAYLHTDDYTWMHGKVYKRSYIENKNIKFHPLLRASEDAYFNNLALNETDKITVRNDIVSYIWRNANDSITRKNDHEFNYKGYHEFIIGSYESFSELIRRKNPQAINKIISTLALIYFHFKSDIKGWKKHKEEYNRAIELFKIFYKSFYKLYDIIDKQFYLKCVNNARALVSKTKKIDESESFGQFVKRLGLEEHELFKEE